MGVCRTNIYKWGSTEIIYINGGFCYSKVFRKTDKVNKFRIDFDLLSYYFLLDFACHLSSCYFSFSYIFCIFCTYF